MKTLLHYLLLLYQKLSPYPMRCRYYPSCSHYADAAILKYGATKGSYLALLRLIRCNQWFSGGYDPVP